MLIRPNTSQHSAINIATISVHHIVSTAISVLVTSLASFASLIVQSILHPRTDRHNCLERYSLHCRSTVISVFSLYNRLYNYIAAMMASGLNSDLKNSLSNKATMTAPRYIACIVLLVLLVLCVYLLRLICIHFERPQEPFGTFVRQQWRRIEMYTLIPAENQDANTNTAPINLIRLDPSNIAPQAPVVPSARFAIPASVAPLASQAPNLALNQAHTGNQRIQSFVPFVYHTHRGRPQEYRPRQRDEGDGLQGDDQ